MFCTACGNPITPQQAMCGKCGAPTSVGMMQGSGRRVADHYRVLGILMIVYSALTALAGTWVLLIAHMIMRQIFLHASPPPPPFVTEILPRLVGIFGWLIIAKAAAGLAAGIGLMNRVPWARTLTLVIGFFSLLSFPFGTAIGIYAIWVLMSSGADREYNELVLAAR